MKNCKLFLTFDHELPLGGVKTSYQEALFDPTRKLLELAAELDIPLNFFTDVLCADRFNEWDEEHFFKPYKNQLSQILSLNHDVQLHIHPHWLTTTFNNGKFLPSSDFKLADFSDHPVWSIEKIVIQSYKLLTEICSSAINDYQCVAYRAGGYNLHPNSHQIIKALFSCGIRFDSSICKNYRFSSALSEVDFSHMPVRPNWFIGNDGDYSKDADVGILEIPIAGMPKTLFEVPTRFKLKKFASQAPADHGMQIHQGKKSDIRKRIKQMFSSRMLTFDNYTYSTSYLIKILEYNFHKYREYDDLYLCAIGHPKTMSAYSFQMLKDFVIRVKEKYKDQVEFYTYRKLYNELKDQMKWM